MIQVKHNLKDDCDTLIVKFNNIIDDHYYNIKECQNITIYEYNLELLEKAISHDDYKAMRAILNDNLSLFKRYR